MLGFVQSWFAPEANPIGVDFGTDCLRLAQVEPVGASEFRLAAAATADVPPHLRNDPAGRLKFFSETMRDLLSQGNFRGRRAILTLPAAAMYVQHVRMPHMDDDALRTALPWETRGKLPIDPAQALLRHLVAGEVYQDQDPRDEVIVMAARRELVDQLLAAAAKARLDVIGMNVEPKAIVDCFCHVYRRKTDAEVTNCFVDIGCSATRAIVARGPQILFARVIPIGGDQLSEAVANTLKISLDDARVLRVKQCHVPAGAEQTAKEPLRSGAAGLNVSAESTDFPAIGAAKRLTSIGQPPELSASDASDDRAAVDAACREPLAKLVEELSLCRSYHEANFPNRPLDRLVFIGGEARHRGICQHIAREIGLAAQVGDPLVRMGRISEVGVESGLDRRLPQPGWAVAIGLSMGPAAVPDPVLGK